MSRFEKMKTKAIQNGPKIEKSWTIKIVMFKMTKSGFYPANMKQQKFDEDIKSILNKIII